MFLTIIVFLNTLLENEESTRIIIRAVVNAFCAPSNRSATVRGRARVAYDGAQEKRGRGAADPLKGLRQRYQPLIEAHGRTADGEQPPDVDRHQKLVAT